MKVLFNAQILPVGRSDKMDKEKNIDKSRLKLMGANHSDDYYTPDEAFDLLKRFIPENKVIFECAVGTGKLKNKMEREGFKVVCSNDFFNDFPQYDVLITNPPFSLKDQFLKEAYHRGKPFAFLLPITALEGIKRQEMYLKHGLQILFPKRRYNFAENKKSPWFYTAWFCWKIEGMNVLQFEDDYTK